MTASTTTRGWASPSSRRASSSCGPDLPGVLVGQRRAPDHLLNGLTDAELLERLDHGPHHRHGRGEERGEADDVGSMLDDGLGERLRGDVDAEVDDLEARALEHDPDDVLADVVDVTLDRPDDVLPPRGGVALSEERLEDGQARL